MSILTRLHVQGFRRLADFDIELRPLCVAIGANSCGKSSFLDVLSLLAASARGELENGLKNLGGLTSCVTRDRRHRLSIEIAKRTPTEHAYFVTKMGVQLDYHLELEDFGFEYSMPIEYLVSKSDKGEVVDLFRGNQRELSYLDKPFPFEDSNNEELDATLTEVSRPNWTRDVNETALAHAPRHLLTIGKFRDSLASCTYFKPVDVSPRSAIRLPQTLRPAHLPGNDGEDLLSCLYTMREQHRDRYEAVEDALRAAFHSFERLELPLVASGMVTLGWKDANFSRSFFANELGEGVLRFLWLVTLMQSPGLAKITLIDEPEVSLHPELLALLADLFREASSRTQLIVATHSDRLVRFLEPKEVLAFDVADDGTTTAKWADEHDLDRWLADYTLDEVWRMGRIGGRS